MLRVPPSIAILAAILPLCAWRAGVRCEASGRALGAQLGAVFTALERRWDVRVATALSDGADVGNVPRPQEIFYGDAAPKHGVDATPRNGRAGASRTVFVDQRTVLGLAEGGAVPTGDWVLANGARPAGIRLSRVSILGVGMKDGDVLTSVEGRAVKTEGQVAALVIAARARRDRDVSALFWRAGAIWTLIVEMPYP